MCHLLLIYITSILQKTFLTLKRQIAREEIHRYIAHFPFIEKQMLALKVKESETMSKQYVESI